MYNKPHITVDFWAMCYEDVIMKSNIVGNLQDVASPYELWTGEKIDLLKTPMLSFWINSYGSYPSHVTGISWT